MDRRFLMVMAMSLLVALALSSMFYQQIAASPGESKSSGKMRKLVVAVNPLVTGATVKSSDIKVLDVAEEQFPPGGLQRQEDVIDRPVIAAIAVGEPILSSRLAARGSGVGLAPMIPVGLRAVSVRVTDVAGVSGFVLPGLRVDVLVTGQPPGSRAPVTTTCLQNIQVVSAGQTLQPDVRGQAIQTQTVTLLVTPQQAELLTLAATQGQIQLVLRNSADAATQPTSGSALPDLYGAYFKPEPEPQHTAPPPLARKQNVRNEPKPPETAPVPAVPEVVVIRGNQRTTERVVKVQP